MEPQVEPRSGKSRRSGSEKEKERREKASEMEAFKGGLKGYWKRRKYQRLDGGGRRRSRAELSGGRRRRFWRIRVVPRLRFLARVVSPKRFLARIRDAYVRMMLSFASSGALAAGYGGAAVAGFGRPQLKEYDEKMIVEIYKSLVARGPIIATATAGGGGGNAGLTGQAARQ